jgi:hypothetical protein
MSEHIKPCPFCGNDATVIKIGNDHSKKRKLKIKCSNRFCRAEQTTAAVIHSLDCCGKEAIKTCNTSTPLPDDVQCMIDAATICETERHGCYGNNTECLFNRFDNGMGCLNNKHVTRLIEYITTGR